MRNQASNLIEEFSRVAGALSDPSRVRLLAACLDQKRCVCQLVALLDLSNASISKHLAQLRDAGLLASRREGRWVHYRLPDAPTPILADAIAMLRTRAMDDEVIEKDRATLANIDAIDPGELARMQREGCCPDLSCCPPRTPTNTPTAASRQGEST